MIRQTTQFDALNQIFSLPHGSAAVLLGAKDLGKTWFAQHAIRQALSLGEGPVGYVDSDIGQSELSIPGVCACALPHSFHTETPVKKWPVLASEFVGASSPAAHIPEWIAAATHCVERCAESGARLIVVDTPGWISGSQAARAYSCFLRLISPAAVILFSEPGAHNPLGLLLAHRSDSLLALEIEASARATKKTTAMRSAKRAAKFVAQFQSASSIEIAFQDIDLLGASFAGRAALPAHVLKFIGGAAGSQCLFASFSHRDGLLAILEKSAPQRRRNYQLEEHFGTSRIFLESSMEYKWRFCGARGADGEFLAPALIESIDFSKEVLRILAPLKSASPIRQLSFGYLRVRSDGKELELPPRP